MVGISGMMSSHQGEGLVKKGGIHVGVGMVLQLYEEVKSFVVIFYSQGNKPRMKRNSPPK